MQNIILGLLAAAVAVAHGGEVVELDPQSFPKMLKSDEVYVTAFTAPWCGHCQRLKPEYEKAAKALKGIVKFANVNMDAHQSLGGPYNVRGFPTIKIFGADKNKPSDFNGQRTAKALVDAALAEAKKVANNRLSGGKSQSRSSGGSKKNSGGGGRVIEAGQNDFADLVLEADGVVMVAFTAPWCGHCQKLHPEYEKAAKRFSPNDAVRFVNVDATQHQSLAGQYGVQGYPTIKIFMNGRHEDYQGGRDASSMADFMRSKMMENRPAPEVKELISKDVFESSCAKESICFISFLPDIRDTQAKGRQDLIQMQKDLAEKNKRRPFGWVWTSAGLQSSLEKGFDVGGFGFPAMVAINAKKKKFATLRGAYTKKSVQDFVDQLVAGRQSTSPFAGGEIPEISTVDAWDGKDAPVEDFEEEFDLSELDDIDLDDDHDEL